MTTPNPLPALRPFLLCSIFAILTSCTPESDFSAQTPDGRYEATIQPTPDPIPLNALFTLDLKVKKNEGGALQAGTTILVDATMPDHNHGMNTLPVLAPGKEQGNYVVQGMLFHMPGLWEISIKIQEGDAVSEAKFKVRL